MRTYYLKHLCRTIRRRPAQPILIVLILSLSFLLINLSLSTQNGMRQQTDLQTESTFGNADFTVSTALTSPSRFLFCEDVANVLPDATVTGTFTMPFLSEGEFVRGCAVSFDSVSRVFDLSFSDYREFYESERERVALITRSLADEKALALGDALILEAFGKTFTYTVTAISDAPLPGNSDVAVDISSAVSALLGGEVLGSLLPAGFAPFGTLYVKLAPGTDRATAYSLLRTRFASDEVYDTATPTASSLNAALSAISTIVVLLTLICAFSVVFCCSFCMAKERAEDAVLFSTAGVPKRALFRFRLLEMAVYAAVGCGIGTLLSLPLCPVFFRLVGIRAVRYRMTLSAFAIGALTVFAVALLAPMLSQPKNAIKKKRVLPLALPLALLAVGAGGCVALFFVGNQAKYVMSLVLTVLLFLLIIMLTPALFRFVTALLSRIHRLVALCVGVKNARKIPAVANCARLLLLIVTLVVTALMPVYHGARFIEMLPTWIHADYAISGGTARVETLLVGTPQVGKISGFASFEGAANGKPINAWAVSDSDILGESVGLSRYPVGTEVITSPAYAAKYNLKAGDTFSLTVGSVTREVTLAEYADAPLSMIFFDAAVFEVPYSVWFVRAADGVTTEDLYRVVTQKLSLESTVVLPADSIVSTDIRNNVMYVIFGELLTGLMALFAIIGIIDTLADSYRSRREELALFLVAGMSRKQKRRMIYAENLCVLFFVLLLSVPCILLSVSFIRQGLFTFGTDLLYFFMR